MWAHLRFAHTGFRCVAGERLRGGPPYEEGAAVKVGQRYLILGIALTLTPVAVAVAAPASADCSGAGAATVCAQGTVRGGGPTAPIAGPAYPGYCADPWYCDDDWGIDIDLNPRPIFPGGGGGGIGPRR
jgi:hypothetical protein